jgi:hypothetical protein
MDKLIEALEIFKKYKNLPYPTHCEHDVLYVVGIYKDEVSDSDLARLDELHFFFSEDEDAFISFHFGSV